MEVFAICLKFYYQSFKRKEWKGPGQIWKNQSHYAFYKIPKYLYKMLTFPEPFTVACSTYVFCVRFKKLSNENIFLIFVFSIDSSGRIPVSNLSFLEEKNENQTFLTQRKMLISINLKWYSSKKLGCIITDRVKKLIYC